MFCIKCGRKINADKCEYCGSANTKRFNNNYFKSSEMHEILSDKSDLKCVEVTEEKYAVQESMLHEKYNDFQTVLQTPENGVSDDLNENKSAIQRSIMSNRIKNVIITVLCIAVVCISASYSMLLNRYNNVVEKSNNIKEGNVADNTENSKTEISIGDNDVFGDSSASVETGTAVNDAPVDNTDKHINKKDRRDQKAESLYDTVKAKKYDSSLQDQILSLYKDKQPIMQFSDGYDYSSNSEEYDIEYAEKCINEEDVHWDDAVSCGELFHADAADSKKLMYYFMESNTYGKQYILADENHVPDIDDIIYIEPINVSEKNLYYMARYCDEVVSMYIVIDNKVYDYIQIEYDRTTYYS